MRTYSWEEGLKVALHGLTRANNVMKMDDPGPHGKVKNKIAKVMKAVQGLKNEMSRAY